MSNAESPSFLRPDENHEHNTKPYDLIVIGAGISGLNALHAATQYLPKTARVLLLDKNPKAGGMWNVAYDYVRLHQPHPMFTVGDISWNWDKPRHYLAKRDEIQTHLEGSLGPISEAVNLDMRFGVTVDKCKEVKKNGNYVAQVQFYSNEDSSKSILHAEQVIHATGLNYREADPMTLESSQVISIVPSELSQTLINHPNSSVIVVGGGKTGMDTVMASINNNPNRNVTLIKGRGTSFLNRTRNLPTGIARWTSGTMISRLFRDMALKFDGGNEDELLSYFRENYATDPDGDNAVFTFGLLSEEELQRIKSGLSLTLRGYLEDVIDTPSGPQIRMRDGSLHPTDPNSIVVNCSGSFFRTDEIADPDPLLSEHGKILTINTRSAFHFLTTASAYFVTHLYYLGKLQGNGIFTLDHEKLFRLNRDAWVGAAATQAYLNFCLAVKLLPLKVLLSCGINLDLWYPLPRRMLGLFQTHITARSDIAHCTHVLNNISERFEVECSPIK